MIVANQNPVIDGLLREFERRVIGYVFVFRFTHQFGPAAPFVELVQVDMGMMGYKVLQCEWLSGVLWELPNKRYQPLHGQRGLPDVAQHHFLGFLGELNSATQWRMGKALLQFFRDRAF